MENQNVTVIYSWKAKEGKSQDLISIYDEVAKQMNANEPGAMEVQCYFDEENNTLFVADYFQDAGAVGFHLQETASKHFPDLLQIASPGKFSFWGVVPDQIKQAIAGMGLEADYSLHQFGFKR